MNLQGNVPLTTDLTREVYGGLADELELFAPDEIGDEPLGSGRAGPGPFARVAALLLVVLACIGGPLALLALPSCTLTPAQVATIEAVDATACKDLEAVPIVGEIASFACPAEEAGLKEVLDADVAAYPPSSTPTPTTRALVTRPGPTPAAPRVLVGLVPAHRAARCTAAYNARAPAAPAATAAAITAPSSRPSPASTASASTSASAAPSVPAVPASSLVPWPDAGVWHADVVAAPPDAGASDAAAP